MMDCKFSIFFMSDLAAMPQICSPYVQTGLIIILLISSLFYTLSLEFFFEVK